MAISGAEVFLRVLEDEEVEYIFGLPGGPPISFYDCLSKSKKIKHILVRHESCASFMADAYAKSSGKVGVCLATAGPGASNLVIGVATAFTDHIPMVAITGQISTQYERRNLHDEIDLVELFQALMSNVQLGIGYAIPCTYIPKPHSTDSIAKDKNKDEGDRGD